MNQLTQKLNKYSKSWLSQTPHLLRLLTKMQLKCANDANTEFLSYDYFRDKKLLAASPSYNKESLGYRLLLNFLPLPTKLEQWIYGNTILHKHHMARVSLIRNHLPKAATILDLGGADAEQPCGALLAMGYPHVPEMVHIIDLPVEDRIHDPSFITASKDHRHGASFVSYQYQSMSDIDKINKGPFDLVWMGQTIEHIFPDELRKILQHLGKILKKDGLFCLDTPNRGITKLLDPYGYIHPDHKKEYTPSELTKIFSEFGLQLEKSLGISPMLLSHKTSLFHRIELLHGEDIGENPDHGFSFYQQYRWKP